MSVRTFLDTATGHLSPEDAVLLDAGSRPPYALPFDAMVYEHGWIVSTASFIGDEDREERIRRLRVCGFSEAFIDIADRAGRLGCWLLRFDRDEDLDPRLPIGGYGLRPEDYEALHADVVDDGSATTVEEANCPMSASEGVCPEPRGGSLDGRVGSFDAGMTASDTFESVMALRALHGDDIQTASLEWRQRLVECERRRCVAEGHELPAFRVCPDWGHHFAEGAPEHTTRWTFDRRSWSLACLEILEDATGTWRMATRAEHADVDESLVTANLEALTGDPDEWGCLDTDELSMTIGQEHLCGTLHANSAG